MKIALFILGIIVTVACNAANARAQEADVAMGTAVAASVLNGLNSASSYSTAEDCIKGDLGACSQVLAETAIVVGGDLSESMMKAARNIFK